ncbi:MAG: hypothetical protein OHK0045_22930 [Raineya sp.]
MQKEEKVLQPKRKEKIAFVKQLNEIKPFLPRYYAIFIRQLDQTLDERRIWNVKNYGYVDWYILDLMKQVAENHKKISKK